MANPINTLTKNAPQSQRSPQDPPQQAPIPKALVDDPEVRERVNAPEGKLKFLGHGQYANVYDLGDGRVLKLTRDKTDALAFANVLHRPSPAFAVTLDVFQLPGKPKTYGIVSERLKPLGAKEEAEWHLFSTLFFYSLRYPLGNQGSGINTPWAQLVHKALAKWSKHVEKVGWKKQSVKEWPFNLDLWESHLESEIKSAILAAMMEYPSKTKFLIQVAKSLEHARIKWWDLHGKNIMRRMQGSRIVIADLGLGQAPRVKIPVLGKSRGPRVFDVNAAAVRFFSVEDPKNEVVEASTTLTTTEHEEDTWTEVTANTDDLATTATLTTSESDEEVILEVPSEGISLYSTEAEILTALAETEDKEIFQMIDSIVKEEGEKRRKKAQPQKQAIFTSEHLIVTED